MTVSLCRIWDKKKGAWYNPVENVWIRVTHDPLFPDSNIVDTDRFSDSWIDLEGDVEIDQPIHRTDKRGTMIFENDIVVAKWHWTEPHVIQWPKDYYAFEEFSIGSEDISIIGNFRENPELAKESEQL